MTTISLEGKTALVTGAATGIGRAIAVALAPAAATSLTTCRASAARPR